MSDGTDAGYTLQDIDDVIDQTPNRVDELRFESYLDQMSRVSRVSADRNEVEIMAYDPTYVPALPTTVEGATRRHASVLNLTPDQFREQAAAYGISVGFFEESVGRQRIDPNEAMRQAAERGVVDFMSDEKRRIALRSRFIQELGRHHAQQDAEASGEEVPEELDILGGLRVSDQQAGFYGSGPGMFSDDTLSDISQQGEAGYHLAAALSKDILDGEDIADQVEIWGRREQGWQSYVDYRTKKAMERRPGLSGQAREDAERRAQRRAVQEIALFKTVGLWTAPVFIPYDLTEGGEVNLRQAEDMGFMDAAMPNIEVIGIKEDPRSGRLETVTRQTGPWQHAFDMADLLQSGATGLISKKEGESLRDAAIRGIANRRNFFEYAIDSDLAEASLPGAIAAGGAGFLAAVAFPDLFVAVGAAKLLPRVAGLIGQRKTMVQAAELLRVTAVESAHGSAALKRLMETDADGTLVVTPGSAEAQDLAADVVARYNAATEAEQALARLSPEISRNLNAADAGVAASFNTVAENADMTLKAARAIDRDLPPTVRRLITAHPAARKGAAEFTAVTEVGDSAAQLLRTEQFNSAEHFEKLIQIRDALQKALTNPDPVKRADEVTKALGRLDAGAVRSEMERVISKGMLDDATARAELRVGQEVDAKALDGLTEDALDDFRRIVREGNTWDTEEGIAAFKQKALDWIAGADLDDVAKDLVTTYTKHIEDHAKHLIGSELDLEKAVVALKRAISSIAPNREARAVAAALVREELMRRLLKKATPIETLTPLREKYWDVTKISTDAKAFAARLQKQLKLDRQQALFLASVFDRRATAWGAAENQDSRRFWDRIAKVFGRKKPEADAPDDGPGGVGPDVGDTPPTAPTAPTTPIEPAAPTVSPNVSPDVPPGAQGPLNVGELTDEQLGQKLKDGKTVREAIFEANDLLADALNDGLQDAYEARLVRAVSKQGKLLVTSTGKPLFWVVIPDERGILRAAKNPKSTRNMPLPATVDPREYVEKWIKAYTPKEEAPVVIPKPEDIAQPLPATVDLKKANAELIQAVGATEVKTSIGVSPKIVDAGDGKYAIEVVPRIYSELGRPTPVRVRSIEPSDDLVDLQRQYIERLTEATGDLRPTRLQTAEAAKLNKEAELYDELFRIILPRVEKTGEQFPKVLEDRWSLGIPASKTAKENDLRGYKDFIYIGDVKTVIGELRKVGDESMRVILDRIEPFIDPDLPFVYADSAGTKKHPLGFVDYFTKEEPDGWQTNYSPFSLHITGRGNLNRTDWGTGSTPDTILHELLHASTQPALGAAHNSYKAARDAAKAAAKKAGKRWSPKKFDEDLAAGKIKGAAPLAQSFAELMNIRRVLDKTLRDRHAKGDSRAAHFHNSMFAGAISDDKQKAAADELISYMYETPYIQELMKTTTYEGKSLWSTFVDTVASLFGIKKEDQTLLGAAMQAHDTMLTTQAENVTRERLRPFLEGKQTREELAALYRPYWTTQPPSEWPKDADELRLQFQQLQRGVTPPGIDAPTPTAGAVEDASAAGAKTVDEVEEARRLWEEEGVESPFFKRWFSASKVVDEAGQPLVVYHGTAADFDEFANPYAEDVVGGWNMFTEDPAYASRFAPAVGAQGSILPVYLSIKNPLDLTQIPARGDDIRGDLIAALRRAGIDPDEVEVPTRSERSLFQYVNQRRFRGRLKQAAQNAGYDGISFGDQFLDTASVTHVAFEPTQIKSKFNRGTFGVDEPRIQMSAVEAPPLPQTPEEIAATFTALGELQIAKPELAMLAMSKTQISPLWSVIAEHVGDIIRRMTPYNPSERFMPAVFGVIPKIRRGLTDLAGDIEGGIRMQAAEHAAKLGTTVDEQLSEIRRLGQAYADAHRELPVYNEIQRLANDAAIAVGEGRFNDAKAALNKLDDLYTADDLKFETRMESVEPEFARNIAEEVPRPLMAAVEPPPPGWGKVDAGMTPPPSIPVGVEGMSPQQFSLRLKELGTAEDAARFIAENASDESYREIAKRIIPFVGKIPLSVLDADLDASLKATGDRILHNARGAMHRKVKQADDQIEMLSQRIWIRGSEPSGLNTQTVLHELLHAATSTRIGVGMLRKNKNTELGQASRQLRILAYEVRKQLTNQSDIQKLLKGSFQEVFPRGFSESELLAWGLTNPQFQEFLKTVKLDPEFGASVFTTGSLAGRAARRGAIRRGETRDVTAYTAFVELIRRVLGISPKEVDALSELIRVSDELLTVPTTGLPQAMPTGTLLSAVAEETPRPLMMAAEPPPPAVPREAIQILEDGRAIIRALTDEPNPEIVIRTLGRLMLQDLNTQELAQVQTWLKTKGIDAKIENGSFVGPNRKAAEAKFEDAFAEYIREYTPATGPFVGPVAAAADIPVGAFARLKNAVASVMASADPQTVPEGVRPLFEKMLGGGVPARGQLLPTVKKIIQKNLLGIIAKDAPKAINRIAREAQRLGLKDISGDALTSQFDATGSVTFKQPLFAKQDVDSKEWTLAQVRDDQGNLVDIGNWDGETFTLTKDDVRRLQLLIDDEQLLLVGQQTPQLVVDSIAQGVEEQSMTERLRQITQGSGRLRQFGRIATFTLFGDDALLDLRMFPPQARQNILAIMRPIQQVIGDAITIASENDLKRNAQFLGGELVAFEKGRPALSSGADYGGLMLRIIESAFDRLDLADQRKLKLAALLTKSTSKDAFNDWGGAFASVNKAGGLNSAYTAAFDKSANMDALKALVDDFMGVTTDGGTLLTEDLSLALGLDVRDPKRILTVFEIFLYHAGQSERIIDGAVRSYDMAQTSQARMLSLFTELKEAGFADNVLNHASVVMAGHGAAERSRTLAARMGLMVNETVYKFYRAMAHGHDVPIKYRAQVEELASKIGMNWLPEYMSNPGPFDGYYVPTVMRERMMDALARVNIKVEKRAARLGSEDTMRGASAVFYTYMKTRVTRGAIFLRQKYFTMNTFDHFFQLAQNQGLLPAIVSVVRVAAQDLLVLPGIARTIYLFQKGDLTDEKAIERVRSALQAGGDKAAHAAGNFLGVSKYNLHINPVMEGADELIKVGNTYYRPSDLRRIAVEEGIFASFDTRALERNIKRQTVELFDTAAAQGASNVRDGLDDIMGMTSDIAEAWSERERLGAMITLIESGMPPRMAARMTVEALYDYAGSMGKLDRLWLINMVLPFWAFQKNANKQVFDAIFSPWGAYRLGVLRRAQEYGPEYLSHIVYSAVTDPYGVDISALEPDAEANYWALRNTIENGWGPLEGLDDDSRRLLENQVGPLEDLSVEDREFLENGYGGLENVPTQVKSAMKMLFRDRGIIVDDGEVMSLSSRLLRAKQQFVMGTASSVIPEAQRSGRASYRVNMPAVAIPIRRTEMVKKYYATMLQQNPEHGFVELFLPESTIYAGMRHMSGVAALMILGASGVVDTAESGLDLVFGEGDDEMPEPSGRMSYTQAAVNLTEEIFPVERGLMLRYLWPYIGIGDAAPTPVHPALGSMIKTEFGIDLLTVPAVRDPFAAQFAETLGISPEIAEQLSTAKQQREYLLSGPWSMFFENAGLGELNRIMWQMEGMRIGDTALAPATRRLPIEYVSPEAAMAAWARRILGVDVVTTMPSETARREEPGRTMFTRLPPSE